jgi:predicted lipoprotein with Yx(FWY)xxD motif
MRIPTFPTTRRRVLTAAVVVTMALPAFGAAAPVLAVTPTASCADPITSVPSGPATVSTARTAFGNVLVIGSGDYAGCSLYLLTSDAVHAISGDPFACSDGANPIGMPCDTGLWPALLTDGPPIAGPGVNPNLLGTVTRTDLPGLPSADQVTYAGYPLYRFFLDEAPGETDGASLFDPVTSPTGIWYLVNSRGQPAPGRAQIGLETAPLNGTGPDATVLSVSMDHGFVLLNDGSFPVYTLSTDKVRGPRQPSDAGRGRSVQSSCQGLCAAVKWPPVLTSGRPNAGPGVNQADLGILVRPDGTHQVTYQGRPLYLFFGDAYIPSLPYGPARIDGAGLSTPWGVFDTIPPQD